MVSLTTPGCPIRSHFQTAVAKAVSALDGVTQVDVAFDVLTDQREGRAAAASSAAAAGCPRARWRWSRTSSASARARAASASRRITANLAAALAEDGKKVGILDADVWGYSIPRMFGLGGHAPAGQRAERKIVPLEGPGGVKVMSIGFFVQEDSAVVWRGPMLHKALTQFLEDVDVGRAGLPARRPAAGHGRRLDDARAAAAAGAVPARHHAAADRAEGRAARRRDGPQGQPRDRRRRREHVRLHDAVAASASRSSARAAARSSPTSSTCRCSARSR